ncbi:MAG: hypothetical protein IPO81_26665 [Kouleothrix sp.]|nr:hypothetical protein [Kouleothrix sp.]
MRARYLGIWAWRLLAVAALLLGVAAAPARAATDVTYVAATGHYVRGVFRDFWDKNGGLMNFGFPLTEEYIDPATSRVFQYFERARFERAQADSNTVELGLIGREIAGSRAYTTSAPIQATKQRRYFAETKHIVQYGFKETWETRGGLKVFGYPISDEVDELLGDGQIHTVQYYERARFEYWPNLPAGQRVLLSLLGRQLAPKDLLAPLVPNAPPSGPIVVKPPAPPSLVRPLLPPSKNARVSPQAGQPGQLFLFSATGFQPGEKVGVWINSANGSMIGASFQVTADSTGAIGGDQLSFLTDKTAPLGVWSFVGQGVASGRQAIGYFLLIGGAIGRLPPPQPGIPANVDARVDPGAGPAGTIFFFDAFGLKPGEEVALTVVASDGAKIDAGYTVKADEKGSIGYAGLYYVTDPGFPLGLWHFEAKGKESGKLSIAYFVLTP